LGNPATSVQDDFHEHTTGTLDQECIGAAMHSSARQFRNRCDSNQTDLRYCGNVPVGQKLVRRASTSVHNNVRCYRWYSALVYPPVDKDVLWVLLRLIKRCDLVDSLTGGPFGRRQRQARSKRVGTPASLLACPTFCPMITFIPYFPSMNFLPLLLSVLVVRIFS
jgi:hypothetical protein